MANRNIPGPAVATRFSGWYRDDLNSRLEIYHRGTLQGYFATNAGLKTSVARLGTSAAVASNGAVAILPDMMFVAPADLRIVSAWRMNVSASDVTKGTATTSASYRRLNLITNTAGAGSGPGHAGPPKAPPSAESP